MKAFVFFCFATIATVAAYDTWAVAENSQILREEQNPVCLKLIQLEPEGRTWFIAVKSLGAFMAMSVLGALLKSGYKHAMLITSVVTTFQLALLIYLCFSDPRMYGVPNVFVVFNSPESLFSLR
jgi:hypothetical protein